MFDKQQHKVLITFFEGVSANIWLFRGLTQRGDVVRVSVDQRYGADIADVLSNGDLATVEASFATAEAESWQLFTLVRRELPGGDWGEAR